MSQDDRNYFSIMLEEILDQNRAVLEAVGQMQDQVRLIPVMAEDIVQIKDRVTVIEAVVKATNTDLRTLENRVTVLEQAA